MYYKIKQNLTPEYLKAYLDCHPGRTSRFNQSFFPYCSLHWNSLSESITKLPTISRFKKALIQTVRPERKPTFGIIDKYGLSLLTRLRVDFSDLREYRYRRSFNCSSPLCACTQENETTEHFFMRCPRYNSQRMKLLGSLCEIVDSADILFAQHSEVCNLLLYGSKKNNNKVNHNILVSSISFIKATKRFKEIEAYNTNI